MSAISSGGTPNYDDHFDDGLDVHAPTDPAAPGDEASVGGAGVSLGGTIPMDTGLSHLGQTNLDFGSSQTQSLNLIAGMATINTNENLHADNDGIGGSASASVNVGVPFVGVQSLGDSMAAARARAVTTPATDTHTSSAAWNTGSYQDQHARGTDVSSVPADGLDSATLGSQTADAAGGGKTLFNKDVSKSVSGALWTGNASFDDKTKNGEVTGSYNATAGGAAASASAGVKVTTQGVVATASASASVTAVDATGKLSYTSPSATLSGVPIDGRVDATVHVNASAEAHANGTLAIEPAAGRVFIGGDVGASAVAKVEGSLTGTAEYKDDSGAEQTLASATLSGYASVGAEAQAHARIGYDNGNISFDIGAGLAWGVGAGYDLKGSVNVKNVALAVVQGIDHATDGAITKVEDEAKSIETRAEDDVKTVGNDIKNGAITVATDVKDGIVTAATDVKNAAVAVGTGVAKAASAVASGVETAADDVGGFFKKIF